MPQRTATIESLSMTFEVVKSMPAADGLEWGEGYRPLGRQALAEIIQGRMAEAVDYWLNSLDGLVMHDRRNGNYSCHLLSELGDIELSVPRTRRFCPSGVLKSYARRGGQGLIAARPTVYPGIPLQRCWARQIRNVLDKVRKADRDAVKADLHAVMNASSRPKALSAARRFADAWEKTYPKAVACLRDDLDDLLACFRYATLAERRQVRTTNAIERRFREVRRRTRPMGTFQDRTSMNRILFAVFIHDPA